MSTISRSNGNRRDIKCKSIHLLGLLIAINCATAIDYAAYRKDTIPRGTIRHTSITTRNILEKLSRLDATVRPTLQDATEHLLEYGALLRIQILDTFGKLVYDHYDDYGMDQIEALYRIYRDTLERSYNIFDIVPSVLDDPDTRPTKICTYINKYVRTCLKESSSLCMDIKIHDEPPSLDRVESEVLNLTSKIYRIGGISANYPNGFTLQAIVDHFRAGRIRFTPLLLSGLFRNVRYDRFDDRIRTAEREIVGYLDDRSRPWIAVETLNSLKDWRTLGQMLREFLVECSESSEGKVADEAAYLSKHVVREVKAVSENIELLGTVYDNSTLNLQYLFELVLPNDTVDRDVSEARDYLLRQVVRQKIVETYLDVEKYQQAGPDQLLLEILGQLREIGFAEDLARSLHVHARFWHKSHMIENLNELLGLFEAYENLRDSPRHRGLMKIIDGITKNLYDSKNVTVELLCSRPRDCLRQGLEIVVKCPIVNDETKGAIRSFVDRTTRGCPGSMEDSMDETIEARDELSMEHEVSMENDGSGETSSSESVESIESAVTPAVIDVEESTTDEVDSEDSSASEESSESTGGSIPEDSGDADESESSEAESSEEHLSTVIISTTEPSTPSTTRATTETSTIPESTEENESWSWEGSHVFTPKRLCRRVCDSSIVNCHPEDEAVANNRCLGCRSPAEKKRCMVPCCASVVRTTPVHDPCEGLDCSGADKENCKLLNCTFEVESQCDGSECSDESLDSDCEGSDCQEKLSSSEDLVACQGGDCSREESEESCEGEECDSETAESASSEICDGEGCPASDPATLEETEPIDESPDSLPPTPSVDEMFSSTIAMIACNNSDPNYQRQLSRLQKMRIIDALLSRSKSSSEIADSRDEASSEMDNSETNESEEGAESVGSLRARELGEGNPTIRPGGAVNLKAKRVVEGNRKIKDLGGTSTEQKLNWILPGNEDSAASSLESNRNRIVNVNTNVNKNINRNMMYRKMIADRTFRRAQFYDAPSDSSKKYDIIVDVVGPPDSTAPEAKDSDSKYDIVVDLVVPPNFAWPQARRGAFQRQYLWLKKGSRDDLHPATKGLVRGGMDDSSTADRMRAEKISKWGLNTSGNKREKLWERERAKVSGGGKEVYRIDAPGRWRYGSTHRVRIPAKHPSRIAFFKIKRPLTFKRTIHYSRPANGLNIVAERSEHEPEDFKMDELTES